jgi:methylthioribose-1-phosphate isomerase
VDLACPRGAAIPIEQRGSDEVTHIAGRGFAPMGVVARYPAFDVTPHEMVTALFTERGVVDPVCEAGVVALDGGLA